MSYLQKYCIYVLIEINIAVYIACKKLNIFFKQKYFYFKFILKIYLTKFILFKNCLIYFNLY